MNYSLLILLGVVVAVSFVVRRLSAKKWWFRVILSGVVGAFVGFCSLIITFATDDVSAMSIVDVPNPIVVLLVLIFIFAIMGGCLGAGVEFVWHMFHRYRMRKKEVML